MEDIQLENKLINKLAKDLLVDVQVNLLNVRDKSMTVSTIRAKWVMQYFKEKEVSTKLKTYKKKLLDAGVDKLQTSDTSNRSLSRIRLEEKVQSGSQKMEKLNTLIAQQAEVLQFLEYALNIVSDFNFTVKHVLDSIKLEQT